MEVFDHMALVVDQTASLTFLAFAGCTRVIVVEHIVVDMELVVGVAPKVVVFRALGMSSIGTGSV